VPLVCCACSRSESKGYSLLAVAISSYQYSKINHARDLAKFVLLLVLGERGAEKTRHLFLHVLAFPSGVVTRNTRKKCTTVRCSALVRYVQIETTAPRSPSYRKGASVIRDIASGRLIRSTWCLELDLTPGHPHSDTFRRPLSSSLA
jgi:hypothetical protein